MIGSILQRIAERSQPAQAVGAWGFLPPTAGVRDLAVSGSSLVEDLSEEFTPEQLAAARVLVRRGDEQLEPNPVLGGESVRGLFLRRTKDGKPFDIVNQHGSLTTNDPPAFHCIDDFLTKAWLGETKTILVAFTDKDQAVFRMLSLPSTPAAGLGSMNGKQLRRLFQGAIGLSGCVSSSTQFVPIARGSHRLLLTGWGSQI